MKKKTAFVTGASGFIGNRVIRVLLNHGFYVRAGVHQHNNLKGIQDNPDCEIIKIDICSQSSLKDVFNDVDYLFHFAAVVDSKASYEKLYRVNVLGTQNVWKAASISNVKKTLYCSSTAVYGLLSNNGELLSEKMPARAVEPYGRSKLEGERVVNEISSENGLKTIVIRPSAVFGPGENTHFGRELRRAAFSKILLGGGFQNKKFSFVHVQDVAEASVFLMDSDINGEIFNITVNQPLSYEEAFQAYIRALRRAGTKYMTLRLFGKISSLIEKQPIILNWMRSLGGNKFIFNIWRPGFDMNYSSQKLLSTSFRLHWENFEDVILSCIKDS